MQKVWSWILAIMIMALICVFSSIPKLRLIDDSMLSLQVRKYICSHYIEWGKSDFFSYMISLHPDFILHKLGHIIGFGLLGLVLFRATKGSLSWAMAITVLFAFSDELHQYFVGGRSSRFGDVVLDTIAALVFIFVSKKRRDKF